MSTVEYKKRFSVYNIFSKKNINKYVIFLIVDWR